MTQKIPPIHKAENISALVAHWIERREPVAQIEAELTNRINETLRWYKENVGPSVPDGWRPIETAPKDGTKFLSFEPTLDNGSGQILFTYWYVHGSIEGWISDELDCNDYAFNPTLWHPLPAPPRNGAAG